MSNRFIVAFEGAGPIVEVHMPAAPRDAAAICDCLVMLVASAETDEAGEPRVPASVRKAGLPRPYLVEGFDPDGRWWTHEVSAADRIDADFQGRWRAVMANGRPATVAELAARLIDVSVWNASPADRSGARIHPSAMPAAATAGRTAPLAS